MLQQYKVFYAAIAALTAVLVLPVDGKAFISEPDVGASSEIKTPALISSINCRKQTSVMPAIGANQNGFRALENKPSFFCEKFS